MFKNRDRKLDTANTCAIYLNIRHINIIRSPMGLGDTALCTIPGLHISYDRSVYACCSCGHYEKL